MTGGTQLGFRDGSDGFFFTDPSLRGCTSRLPGAWSLDMLGVSGCVLYLALMPRADAKLFAIEDDRLRPGYRWCDRVGGGFAVAGFLEAAVADSFRDCADVASSCPLPSFSSSSGMSSVLLAWLVGPVGSFNSSERRLWCCSSSFRVRRASVLLVDWEAFANSPAA